MTICNGLEKHGLTCWIAPRDIPYELDWRIAIRNAISNAKAFLLVISLATNSSMQVKREVAMAELIGLPMVAIMSEPVTLSPNLKYFFVGNRLMDGYNQSEEVIISKLVGEFEKVLKDKP